MRRCGFCKTSIAHRGHTAATCGSAKCQAAWRRSRNREKAQRERDRLRVDAPRPKKRASRPCSRCGDPTTNRLLCNPCFTDEDRMAGGACPKLSDEETARFAKNLHALERHVPYPTTRRHRAKMAKEK